MLLSLVICHVPGRERKLERLLKRIEPDRHLIHLHVEQGRYYSTIGECRQNAIEQVDSEYLFFVDDDDLLTEGAIPKIVEALDERPDCLAIKEIRYEDGIFRGYSHHDMACAAPGKYRLTDLEWRFDRYINHVCPTRTEIVKHIGFDIHKNRGEDGDYSERLRASGRLKTQVVIEEPIYEYWYRTEALRDHTNNYEMKSLGMAD